MFNSYETPVTHSVIKIFNQPYEPSITAEPFINYILLWIAFNNIYIMLAKQNKLINTVKKENGITKYEKTGNCNIEVPKVNRISERKQIKNAHSCFSDKLKHNLIIHKSTDFFVYRIPKWQNEDIEFDKKGQRLNGVIKVSDTTNTDEPVWSPIEIDKYEQYLNDKKNISLREDLALQILFVLYSIRNNTFHGGKRMDDANDKEVVEKAIPLLSLIVDSFYSSHNLYH